MMSEFIQIITTIGLLLTLASAIYYLRTLKDSRLIKKELAARYDREQLFMCELVHPEPSIGFPPRPRHSIPPRRPGRSYFKEPLKNVGWDELIRRKGTLSEIMDTSLYYRTAQQMLREIQRELASR